jgi:predicted nucleic acid-binding protein
MAEASLYIPDANAALRWLLAYRQYNIQATELIRDFGAGRVALLAPYHFLAEVSGGIRRAIAGRSITYDEGQRLYRDFRTAHIPTFDSDALNDIAFLNCQRYSISFKDSLYVTLAQLTQGTVITTDGNLLRATERFLFKMALEDYPTK